MQKSFELLRGIVSQLVGIQMDDLTTAERNIVGMLQEAGLVVIRNGEVARC